jgi:hypothetical protein
MGLFDEWKNKSYAQKMQQTYLSDFEKGQVNKGTELAEGLVQSVLELGVKAGLTRQETLDKLNSRLAQQPDRLSYDNKVMGAMGEIVGELTVAAPASAMGWFGAGGKITQIAKQGLFGGAWEYFTKPVLPTEDREQKAMGAGAMAGGATAVLGAIGRPLEKLTHYDFKENIKAVRDASASLGISPKLLGDFTGSESTRAAEAISKARGGGVVDMLKDNINQLKTAGGTIEAKVTGGKIYSGQAGENIAKAVQTNYSNATQEGNKLYTKLDALASQNNLTKIIPSETEAAIKNVLSEYGDLFKVLERPALETKLISFGGKLGKEEIKQPAGLILSESGVPIIPEIKGPAEFTFSDIRKAREGLVDALQVAKGQGKLGNQEAVRLNEVMDAMDRDIEKWGESVAQNKTVADAWDTARTYWRGNVIPLRDADLAIAMIKDPNSNELKTDVAKLVGKIVSSEATGQEGAKRAAMMVSKVLPEDVKADVAAATFNTARNLATDPAGNFDPIKFSTFLQSRKQNLQPFVTENLDNLLNKYSFLSQSMTRQGNAFGGLDEAASQATRMGVAAAVGGPAGAAIASVPANRLMEMVSRSAFDTSAGRAIMLSGKSLDDFRPLLTGGLMSNQLPEGVVATPEWVIPPELGGQQQPSGKPEEYVIPEELMPMAVQTMGSENVAPSRSPFSGMNPQLQPTNSLYPRIELNNMSPSQP